MSDDESRAEHPEAETDEIEMEEGSSDLDEEEEPVDELEDEPEGPTPSGFAEGLGEGPYRTPPGGPAKAEPKPPSPLIYWVAAALSFGLLYMMFGGGSGPSEGSIQDVPAPLLAALESFPAPPSELPIAAPLAPLLAADQPAGLALLSPGEGAMSLRRGGTITLRFNRPMVQGREVGRPLAESPVLLDPPIPGRAEWLSRSSLIFRPEPGAWVTGTREATLTVRAGLRSIADEVYVDDGRRRVVVFDGTPRILTGHSNGRVSIGAPLPLVFDAQPDLTALRPQLFGYEIGGGQRAVPLSLVPRGPTEQGYRIDLRMARALEPGTRIGVAVGPGFMPYGGSSPGVLRYELSPPPQIEGIDCRDGAYQAYQCSFQGSPGRIIDIGPTLRVLASERLSDLGAGAVRISPPIARQEVRLQPFGSPARRLIEISGEWAADQVYEVRLAGLHTERGEVVRLPGPLAVRSRGHSPEVRAEGGRFSYERGAEPRVYFSGIHVDRGQLRYREVPGEQALYAATFPEAYIGSAFGSAPMQPLLPQARPNRWGAGSYLWEDGSEGRGAPMAVLSFSPDGESRGPVAFVQRTDLGISAQALPQGILVWVTSLYTAEPLGGARVILANAEATELGRAETDEEGLAWVRLSGGALDGRTMILVEHEEDRAILALDPRAAVGPSRLGVASRGGEPPNLNAVATVFADRGAYRPGESMHIKVAARSMNGANATPIRHGVVSLRLFGPGQSAPLFESEQELSRFGTAAASYTLPEGARLGTYRVEAARGGQSMGSSTLTVAEFRQPTFRVDIERGGEEPRPPLHGGDSLSLEVSGRYLFGAPVGGGQLHWSITRAPAGGFPSRYEEYTFAQADGASPRGTLASDEGALDEAGLFQIETPLELSAPVRHRLSVEAEVRDRSGQSTTARRSFTVYPAEFEVGLRRGEDWVEAGQALVAEAIAIDHEGNPVEGRPLTVELRREGWHSWWEWAEGSHRRQAGYQLRRDQEVQVVHTCQITSALEAARCEHLPSRPGTYVIEVRSEDEAGRTSRASRRLYVAGPDEHPDRDPPGAPIAVTPAQRQYLVGQEAEIAFESPWERAQALITVEREGVLRQIRREVGAGGQIVRIPMDERMVPNVFLSVTLVRPRSGEPEGQADLGAPDLRFGAAELRVRPATSRLSVTIEAEEEAHSGTETRVRVRVRDQDGEPVRSEVALWAVDEGTLRLTDYEAPDPTLGFYRSYPAAFALEDLRRSLVSRIAPPPMPRSGGDGGDDAPPPPIDSERERIEPTPLWLPQLTTDGAGEAEALFELPGRPTEYRIMAVALDEGVRWGRASTRITASQPLVVRHAFPLFLTTGDRFEATAFVHNTTDRELEVEVRALQGERALPAQNLRIAAHGEARFTQELQAPAEGPMRLAVVARAGHEEQRTEGRITIVPRGRFVRSHAIGGGRGEHSFALRFPEGTSEAAGELSLTLANHPLVGLEGALASLEEGSWQQLESEAAIVLGLASYARIFGGHPRGITPAELRARGSAAVARLLLLRAADGRFGRWSRDDYDAPPLGTVFALEALQAAEAAGFTVPEGVLEGSREWVGARVDNASFGDAYGVAAVDTLAYALRVLAAEEDRHDLRLGAVYEQREMLSPFGEANLALAMVESDLRRDTLITSACETALADRDQESTDPSRLRYFDRSARSLGAVLAAASRIEVGRRHVRRLVEELLQLRGPAGARYPWGDPLQTAQALASLRVYADLFHEPDGHPALLIDGQAIEPTELFEDGAYYRLPLAHLARGEHQIQVQREDDELSFFSIDSRFAVPLGEPDQVARGRRVVLHRVLETAGGRVLQEGDRVRLGEMIRVRLFLYNEGGAPDPLSLRDPLGGGFEAVQSGFETSAQGALRNLLGTGPDDDLSDPRGFHAARTLSRIVHRRLDAEAATFYLSGLRNGLNEVTYAVRATTPGTFTLPPTQIEALYDADYVARSAMTSLVVER